ncbi:hypothetical protein OS493_003686 [Desmophyllum pertusum]|uniref:Phosphatidylethanolamine N-methyltransferase n=1 Tax=Desmophyllum pertusum TaxID=174260 RepID=A0A9X0A9H5_9CNID|nr:hypothetical protein OS493_003686 [Desmophyllum pertusum]
MADLALSCCEIFDNLNITKMIKPIVEVELPIYWINADLWLAAFCIIFNPLFWNIVARWEYRTHALTHWFGSAERGCYGLAGIICLLGLFRDYWFEEAISSQPIAVAMCADHVRICGTLLIVIGTVLVLSSTWSLGIIGTFLGDYFGLLLTKRVTGFPFNVMNNPMYWGSTMNFLGYSLRQCSPAGIVLTTLVAVCYKIALLFEGPFTEKIYAEKKLSQEKED